MDAMTLGSYTFAENPAQFTEPKNIRHSAFIKTYSSVAFYSWGIFIAGEECVLEWEYMAEAMFEELQAIIEADTQVVWNPQTGETYNVEALSLDGPLIEKSILDAPYRKDVKLLLLIMSEV